MRGLGDQVLVVPRLERRLTAEREPNGKFRAVKSKVGRDVG